MQKGRGAAHDEASRNAGDDGDAVPAADGDADAIRRLLRFGGWTLVDSLVALFLDQAPKKLAAMRAALETVDVGAVELASHSLKSSAAQLGAPRMEALARAIEQRAHEGSLDDAAERVLLLEDAFGAWTRWLDASRATLRDG